MLKNKSKSKPLPEHIVSNLQDYIIENLTKGANVHVSLLAQAFELVTTNDINICDRPKENLVSFENHGIIYYTNITEDSYLASLLKTVESSQINPTIQLNNLS